MRMVCLAVVAIFSFSVSAQVYKWTDENGVTHFGSQPPPGQNDEVQIRNTHSDTIRESGAPESDIIRQVRELEREKQQQSLGNAEARYRERVNDIREDYENRPDYICQGAENRLKAARERWEEKKRQGYTISDERYHQQRIRSQQRHRDNVCR